MPNNTSETVTENLFRNFYGSTTFIEKSAIPNSYGFKSKAGTSYKGYPDFFKEVGDFVIAVEAKATNQAKAVEEVKWYMTENSIEKDIIGIAISGQSNNSLKVNYFYKLESDKQINTLGSEDCLLDLDTLKIEFENKAFGSMISNQELNEILNNFNEKFNDRGIRDTDRSLFFSGIMIALCNDNFRNTYRRTMAPSMNERARVNINLLDAHYLNKAIIEAVEQELEGKINSLSKEYSWKDRFSFIKTIDIPLDEYIDIIKIVENKIFKPFKRNQKQDLLGKAYKIFLSHAGSVDNRNIILTPDHIKTLMTELASLSKDDVILDTCTGSGGFLMEAMEKLLSLVNGNPRKIKNIKEKQLIGFETDPVLLALACSNMFLHGDGRTNMLFRSSLLEDNELDNACFEYIRSLKPNKIIINPPYENNKAYKFTVQAINFLEPNGKLIIIMPTPTLRKNCEKVKKLLEECRLDFVIKMPKNLFSEQKRRVNSSIFGFTKTPSLKTDEVLFLNMENDGHVSIQHKGRVDKGNWNSILNEAISLIRNSREKDGICEKRKIWDGDKIFVNGIKKNKENSNNYELKKFSELFKREDGTLQSESANPDGDYDFITGADVWKKHDTYDKDQEAIVYIVKSDGSSGKAHYVNGKFTASSLSIILTEKDHENYPINLKFYAYYLNSIRKTIVNELEDGTSKLTIPTTMLDDYLITYIPIEVQNSMIPTIEKLERQKDELDKINNDLLDSLSKL